MDTEWAMIASSLVAAACAGYLVAAHRRDKTAAAQRAASKAKKAAALAEAAARREDEAKRAEEARARRDAKQQRAEKKRSRVPGDVRASAPELALVRVEYEEDEDIEPTRVGADAERRPIVSPLVFDADAAEEEGTYSRSLFLVSATAQTDTGMRRKRNEDSLLVDADENLFAVADGMGGYRGGEVASRLAVEALRRAFHGEELPANDGSGLGKDVMRLANAVQAANDDILDTAKREHLDGMGTTVCAARFSPNKRRMFVGHVGDSRCYRLRDGRLDQMTSDHTMADLGVRGPQAAHLSRAVGIWPSVPIDVISAAPRPGDVYLLCSDGLTKMVGDTEIARVLNEEHDPNVAVERLIALANANGGKDNVTVIVVRVTEPRSPSSSSMRRRSPRDSSPAFG